jgi:carlactone synthase/all-trans-10'-apo-beta-carotenal 13,14-cleaving dioxygenase
LQVASVEVPPSMALHFINSYELKDNDGRTGVIIADSCEYYADPAIIEALALHRLRSRKINKDAFPEAR